MSLPDRWRPSHAYVPGLTPRHADGLFDRFKDARPGDPLTRLSASVSWAVGQDFLRAGYFWEAHEVLEALWLACPPNGAERLSVQAAIQLANAGLKARMGRKGAAVRLLEMARDLTTESLARGCDPALALAPADWNRIAHEIHSAK
jgi:uncharacterized protein